MKIVKVSVYTKNKSYRGKSYQIVQERQIAELEIEVSDDPIAAMVQLTAFENWIKDNLIEIKLEDMGEVPPNITP